MKLLWALPKKVQKESWSSTLPIAVPTPPPLLCLSCVGTHFILFSLVIYIVASCEFSLGVDCFLSDKSPNSQEMKERWVWWVSEHWQVKRCKAGQGTTQLSFWRWWSLQSLWSVSQAWDCICCFSRCNAGVAPGSSPTVLNTFIAKFKFLEIQIYKIREFCAN